MGKIILYIATSLDGYIARENGSVDWLPEHAESGYDEFYKTVDTVLMGRKTYEQILTFGAYPYEGKKSYVLTSNIVQKKDFGFTKIFFLAPVENVWKRIFFAQIF